MKPFRITLVLLALLVLPLLATQALADFPVTQLTESWITPLTKVSANSDTLVMAFLIPASEDGETLATVKVRSYIERSFATERVRLWVESGGGVGLQKASDTVLKTVITSTHATGFQSNDVITLGGINYEITDGDTFYITLDMYNSQVLALPDTFHETGLEVIIDAGFIEFKNGEVNTNELHNDGWNAGPPIFFNPYILIFDTQGPQFDLHFCIEDNTCSLSVYGVDMVDHDDSVRVCATSVDSDIYGDITVIGNVHLLGYVSSLRMFGVSNVKLKCPDVESGGCSEEKQGCDTCWTTSFRIPDVNTSLYRGIDADTGHWYVCAFARDTAGNWDTLCIGHDDLLYMLDTEDPIIDSVTWEHVYDWNSDGKIGLGDSIMIIGWGISNPWEPQFECDKMEVNWTWYSGVPNDWRELDDVRENNRIFRKVFGLTTPLAIDSTDCPVELFVRAWDNACNWDTLTDSLCATLDLDPPSVSVIYEWHTDYDTSYACIGIGDKVLIRATVGGNDIVSVTAMMDSAGIDALMRHALPLTHRGGGVYDTIWTVTEPPILYGKDADNSTPPPTDNVYGLTVIVCDDVGNCDTSTGTLNKTLDTRIPRPIGFNCPDSVPCALHARSKPGGIIELYWDEDCDENDAFYYYVWANDGSGWDSIGATNITEQVDPNFMTWHSEPLVEGYWTFKIKTQDNCSNIGPFSCVVGAYADATPPHVCIAVPDSGLTFGSWFPLKAVADSESHDVANARLWYRIRPDIENPTQDPGTWTECLSAPYMYRPGNGYVFTDSVHCLEGLAYIGWVEMIVVVCDSTGNCQDTISAWDDACLVDNDVFRPGRFLFYWDTLAPGLHLVSVNGFPSPQSACGFDVDPDTMNAVVIDVDGATSADSFEVEVRGPCSGFECRIFHEDNVTMPCTIWVSVDGWPEGSQYIYINVKNYDNDRDADLQVELCVPPQPPDHCIYIDWPHEWMRIPCTGTSGYNCVQITARVYEHYQCDGVLFTEARFQWSPNGIDTWQTIEDVIGSGSWSTCWDNKGEVEHGDTVYLRVIAHDEFYMADTSNIVKVFVDCEQPQVTLRVEDLFYTCGSDIPKISCDPLTLKAVLADTLIDIDRIRFFFKRHSVPDIHEYWIPIDGWAEPAWSDNIWMYYWEDPCCGRIEGKQPENCMYPNDYWDIRVAARDIAGHYMFDYDEDGFFDDSTFNDAVAFGAGITVYLDNEAPEPAISLVRDESTGITVINPSELLGGSDNAYVQAGHDITVEVSVLPSEDTCEVMKVHWYLGIDQNWVHVGTSTDPYHFPLTFNPLTDGLIPPYELEDGWWEGPLMAELHDSLGNISTDEITLYILDITPTQAIITSPLNESYVWGNVPLRAMALNDYEICKLCYEYSADGETWLPVNGGYPNACVIRQEFGEEPPRAPGIKITSGAGVPSNPGDNCGNPLEIHIPGDLPYHEFGQTTCGRGDYDNDGCLYAWDGAKDIYYQLIVTQSVDLDIRLDPHDTPRTGMAIGSECKLHGYCQFKSTTYDSYPHGWTDIHLDPGTYYLQIDGRWDGPSCIEDFDLSIIQHGFPLEWLTLNTVPDGAYYLRAVATDCSNNEDDNPRTIRVTVANELPTATIENPATACTVICPDSPEDTIGYVNGTVDLYATASSTIPVNKVEFYYKSIFGYPTTYTLIGTDYFPTGDKYSVQWNTGSMYGRYHLMARVYNAAGRYGDSEPIEIGVDNSAPFSQIISIDGNSYPNGMDISKGDVIDIELVAIDSTSDEGWTRCYNSGLTSIQMCIERCNDETPGDTIERTKCFEVTPVADGFHTVQWNTSGLEFEGCSGCYYLYVKATDCLGNTFTSTKITVYVSDTTAPITTIGGFDGNTILGYSSEKVKTLLFEYADSGSTNWIPIGWSSYIDACNGYYLYMTSWNPATLANGVYQVRVISHDTCSNQDDEQAPWAFIHVQDGTITPYNPDVLGDLSFEKNWCVGGMHGIVRQNSSEGAPVVIAYYGGDYGECVEMQHPQDPNNNEYAGSFFATAIDDGGPAKFFSSITVIPPEEYQTGEPARITYLTIGSFDVVQVKRDLGTHGTYQDGCVEVTIPGGAVGGTFTFDRYIWVAPTMMPWAPITQPDINPIGDNNGKATYVSFTDCYYCCGWWHSHYGGDQGEVLKSPSDGDDCCFNPGRYAKIKMCYDTTVTTDKEHLAVVWWDCQSGEFKFDGIFYPATVEGFNTDEHYVEFATTCLEGPFAVVELLERPCEGSIVVSMREQDIQPYCNGYTSPTPKFTALVTDNVQGTSAIDTQSIQFKVDLFTPGQLVRIYDGSKSGCYQWQTGFGSFQGAGYNKVSGIFRAGWSDSTYGRESFDCDGCVYRYLYSDYKYYCYPMYPLAAGEHMATVTAMNTNIQTCTDAVEFYVDATEPMVLFDTIQVYVSRNPVFNVYMWDYESGVNRSNMYMDVFGSNTSYSQPTYHEYITTIHPDQLASMWVNDTTLRVDLRSLNINQGGGFLHIYIYDGNKCGQSCPSTYYQYYYGGVSDCVGNKTTPFWHYYTVDMYGPVITAAYTTLCDTKLKFQITDAMSGLANVYVYEDSTSKPLLIERDPHNPIYWYYTPSAGPHHVDIRAVDSLNNWSTYSFDLKGDCTPPVVSFIPGYINCKTPTVRIVVTDEGTGVMWDSVKVDLYTSTYLLQTFEPDALVRSGDTITVVGNGTQLELTDGSNLTAAVYYEKTSETSYTKGPKDLAGNWTATQWIKKSYKADCAGPSMTLLTPPYASQIRVKVTDAASGVDATSFEIKQNDVAITTYTFDASSGVLTFAPTLGVKATISVAVADNIGNIGVLTFNNYDTYGSWAKDDVGPVLDTMLVKNTLRTPPVKIKFTDALSGVCWDHLTFMVDSHVVPNDSLTIYEDQGLIEYMPEHGRKQVVVTVIDNVGNKSMVWPFWSEAGDLYFTDPHGAHCYPNPFDPRDGITCIQLVLSKSAYVTAKVYDFAGEFVRTLKKEELVYPNQTCEIPWDGKTESGTEVANGTYLCHIKARDPETSKIVTAVIKITVLKKDK